MRPLEWALCLVTEDRKKSLRMSYGGLVCECRAEYFINVSYWHYMQEKVGFPQLGTRGSDTPESGPCSLHSSALRLYGGGSSTGCRDNIFGMLKMFGC